MAYHIAVGKVQDDNVVGSALNTGKHLVGDQIGAHFRLQVIGGHLGRGDQGPVLLLAGSLHPTVKEKGHMGILLGFCNTQLGLALLGKIFAQGVVQGLGTEGHQHVGHGSVILGHAHISEGEEALLPVKSGKVRIHQGPG